MIRQRWVRHSPLSPVTSYLTAHPPSMGVVDGVDKGDFPIPPELVDRLREIELKLIELSQVNALPKYAGKVTQGKLSGWRRLGQLIGNFPGSMSYEYLHVVGRRRILHEISMCAYELEAFDVLDWLLPTLEVLDEVYRSKTTFDSEMLFYFWSGNPSYWWELRVPNDVGLMEDFRAVKEAGVPMTDRHRERLLNPPTIRTESDREL